MITATVMDTTTAATTAGIERRPLHANGPESHPFWRVAFLLRRYLTRAASPIKHQPSGNMPPRRNVTKGKLSPDIWPERKGTYKAEILR
jgi:hypothetical protein